MPTSKQSFEFEGPHALETAKTILSNYDISGEVEKISVELEESHQKEGVDSEGNEQSAEEEDRELKQIQTGTNHHKVLTAVKNLADKGYSPVTGTQVAENASDVKEGSTRASLYDLWKRRLVERERIKKGGNYQYEYKISGYGEQEISRIGMWSDV
jgi:hypothetical protein